MAWLYWPWLIRLCACSCICAGSPLAAGAEPVVEVLGVCVVCELVAGADCLGLGLCVAFGLVFFADVVGTTGAVGLLPFESAMIAPAMTSRTAIRAATGIQPGSFRCLRAAGRGRGVAASGTG